MLRHWLRSFLLAPLAWVGITLGDDESFHNDPIGRYDRRSMAGFTVLVSPRLRDHPAEAEASLRELDSQLANIARVVKPKPLGALRKIPIWVEWAETKGLGEFHWNPDTLAQQHRNPDKSRSMEITNARHLVEWAKIQPWSVLHELAHGYHCTVLTDDDPRVIRAYQQAVRSRKYDKVDRFQGPPQQRAYALANKEEYFAETTEAYFGRNDFAPFSRDQLKSFDPTGYKLMVDVWGTPVGAERGPTGPSQPEKPGKKG